MNNLDQALSREDRSSLQRALTTVRELMTTELVTLRPDQLLGEAMTLFSARQFRHILVTDGDRLAGVISDRDILRAYARGGGAAHGSVSSIMTKNSITILPDASVTDATRLMTQHRINCLPVVSKDGQVQGILTTTDLMQALYAVQIWLERRLSSLS